MKLHDFVVVGSGCTGVMAAQTLIEAGARVLMLDVGKRDERYAHIIPEKNFTAIRESESQQYRYFLGDDFESIPMGAVTTGEQLTPPRRFIIEGAEQFLRFESDTFLPLESLAYGGLGAGWGLGCCVFSDAELKKCGLPVGRMREAYQRVSDRVGLSGAEDDARPYTFAHLRGVQSPPRLHPAAAVLLTRYARKRRLLQKRGFHLGRPALALLTQDKGTRKATTYREMEFYDDKEGAAWRPWLALDTLRRSDRFQYCGQLLVTHFTESDHGVIVTGLDLRTGETTNFCCRKLLLAPGPLGTTRIVLRSLNGQGKSLPLLCNAYVYLPCVVPSQIGKDVPRDLTGTAQLSFFHDPDASHSDVAMASLYAYRSLLLFRLLREVPLGFKDARVLMQYLLSGLLIVGIHHPEQAGPDKSLSLKKDELSPTGDRLSATYRASEEELQRLHARENAFIRALRKLGACALKRVSTGYGSSIHYAGTLPFNDNAKPFTLQRSGRLNGTRHVFVADGSGLTYLPAKGLTLTLMANAHLVAQHALTGECYGG